MSGPWQKYQEASGPWQKYAETPESNVVATTEDGGQVMRMQDGSLAFKSAGFATTNQERIAEIMEGAKPVDLVQRDRDEQVIAANPVAARAQEFNQGVPLIGEWLDEAVGVVSPEARDNMREASGAMERQRPGQSAALNVAGGIAYAAPMLAGAGGGKAADFVARGGTKLSRAVRAGAVAAPAGAAEGAVSFAGRGETKDERMSGAATGAAVGGTLAAVLGGAAPLAIEGVAGLAKRVKRLDVATIADEFGVSAPAARMVKRALMNDDLDAATKALSSLGDDAMLADAGAATGALLDAGTATGGKALTTARRAVDDRASQFGKRLTAKLDNVLGKPVGVKTAARDIAQSTSPARQAAYTRAYSAPINYADDAGRAIEATLARVPAKTLRSAISEANEAMQAAGVRNMQIMAEIADDGSVMFREMPNVQQLDEIKKAIGSIGREAVDQFGRPTAQGSRARGLSRDLGKAISDAVPAYKSAVKLGGDKIQRDEALDLGRRLLWASTKAEDVQEFMASGVSKEAKQAMRQGLRDTIEDTLSRVKRTITDPNTDAREAMKLVKEVSDRANRKKLTLALGKPRANAILDELEKQASVLELRSRIATNSKTAIRQSIQEEGAAEVAPGLLRRTAGNMGNPLDAAREVTQTIAGIDPQSMTEAQRALFGEIAERLVNIRGADAQRALAEVRKAMAGQPMKDEAAALIGRVIGGGATVGAYQAGTRLLER